MLRTHQRSHPRGLSEDVFLPPLDDLFSGQGGQFIISWQIRGSGRSATNAGQGSKQSTRTSTRRYWTTLCHSPWTWSICAGASTAMNASLDDKASRCPGCVKEMYIPSASEHRAPPRETGYLDRRPNRLGELAVVLPRGAAR